jgi:hypothetical protein
VKGSLFIGSELKRVGLMAVIPLLLAVGTRSARAEGVSDANAAETLGQAGESLLAEGDVAGACRKFRQSSTLEASAPRLLVLAQCWERAGKTASAWEAYRRAADLGPAETTVQAREGEARVAAHLTRLEIRPPTGADFGDVEVDLDGSRLSPMLYGVALPVDPGAHELTASATGRQRWALELNLPSGPGTTSVRIPESSLALRPRTAPPAPALATGDAPSANTAPPGQTMRTVGLVLGGAGIAGLTLGTVFAFKARADHDDLQAVCAGDVCAESAASQLDKYRSDALVANTALVIGASSLVGGVVVYLLAPSAKASPKPHVAVEPLLGPGVAGLHASGTF